MKKFLGTWNIIEMDEWDAMYLHMETQAYIRVDRKGYGEFHFGLVQASIHGEMEEFGGEKRFSFTFEGKFDNAFQYNKLFVIVFPLLIYIWTKTFLKTIQS